MSQAVDCERKTSSKIIWTALDTQSFTVTFRKKHWPTEGLDEPQRKQKESKRSGKIEGKRQVPLLQ